MLARVSHFAFGPVSPALALLSATLGCLLGIMLAARSQKFTGRKRVRLLLYASISVGVTGVWQASAVALLGLDVPESVLRYDPSMVAASLGVAITASAAGMFLIGYGRTGFWRLIGSGVLFGVAVVGTHTLLMHSIRVGGTVSFNVGLVLVSGALAMGVATLLLWSMLVPRGLRSALGAAVGMGLAIAATHYVGEAAIEVRLGAGPPDGVAGLGWLPVALITVVLGTALIAMMWYFTFGTATREDLHAIFDPGDDSLRIDPQMVEEVTARIGLTTTGEIPVVADGVDSPVLRTTFVPGSLPIAGPHAGPLPRRREPGPRPTPGITPVWRTMPVWGRPGISPDDQASRAWAARNTVTPRLRERLNPPDLSANSHRPPDSEPDQAAPAAVTELVPTVPPPDLETPQSTPPRPPGYGSPLPRRNRRI